jgi:hypothetical protein
MKGEQSQTGDRKQNGGPGFRISGGPVVRGRASASAPIAAPADFGQLPTNYGDPILFAIPRDPQTIFTYWNIDWSGAFTRNAPIDRQVYLRLKRPDGIDEMEEPIEPMLGTHFISVSEPKATYQVELGFYDPVDVWNSLASSEWVTMPADSSSENADLDVATVPFHLSFQRMIDLFRTTKGDTITSLLSRLQDKAAETPDGGSLTDEENEILRAMDLSLSDLQAGRRSFSGRSTEDLLRKRAEAVLGFGGTSPSGGPGGHGLGGSSWGSGVS